MVDVILASDNLTVLGGPEELQVDLNIGADGRRGGIFFTGLENPTTLDVNTDFPSVPQSFDFYIDVNPTSENYLQVYQYFLQDGVLSWYPSFKLNSDSYQTSEIVSFATGSATVNLDVTNLGLGAEPFDELTNSFAYFNVQASISNINSESAPDGVDIDHLPAAMSVKVGDAFFDGTGLTDPAEFPLKLPIELTAVQYSNGAWLPIDSKDVIVYFTVRYANPNNIISNLAGGQS